MIISEKFLRNIVCEELGKLNPRYVPGYGVSSPLMGKSIKPSLGQESEPFEEFSDVENIKSVLKKKKSNKQKINFAY